MRICRTCKIEKLESEFSVNKHIKDGLDTACKSCKSIKNAKNYAADVEAGRQRACDYRRENPDKFKETNHKHKDKVRDEENAVRRYLRTLDKSSLTSDELATARQDFISSYRSDVGFKASHDATSRQNSKDARKLASKKARRKWVDENRESINAWNRNWARLKRRNDPEWAKERSEYRRLWKLRKWHDVNGGIEGAEGMVRYVEGKRITDVDMNAARGWQQNHCYYCNGRINKEGFKETIEHIIPRSKGGPDITQNLVLACNPCNCSKRDKFFWIEWKPNTVIPIADRFFLTPSMGKIAEKLTNADIDWRMEEGKIIIRSREGKERNLFIVSTFFGSDRNPASNGGRICIDLQNTHKDPIILLDREWFARPDACINMMKAKMGIADKGPGARKLDVVDVFQADANIFLDSHHVMGKPRNVTIRLGLTDGSTLHAVAAFSDKEDHYEWDRLAFKGHIAGGMSKLMKGLWRIHGYKPIRSFVDTRYADGSGHETVGFKHEGMSSETYLWVFPDRLQHQRYLSDANKWSSNLLYFNPSLTPEDNIRANGVFKIWTPKKHIILIEQ